MIDVISVGYQGPAGAPGSAGATHETITISGNYVITDISITSKTFNGTLSADAQITCPAATYAMLVRNSTSGDQDLILTTGSSSIVRVRPNTTSWVYCDGTNTFNSGPENNVVDARKFGVKWNGVTDDAAALANALTYLRNVGGGILQLPPGIGVCGGDLDIPDFTIVQGLGGVATRINYMGSGSLFNWYSGHTGQTEGLVSIKNLMVRAASTAKSAIKTTGIYRLTVEGVLVNGLPLPADTAGFSVGGIEVNSDASLAPTYPSNTACINIYNNGIFQCAGKGISFTGDGGVGGYCNIFGNRINANNDWGVYFNQITGGGTNVQSEAAVIGNDIEGNNGGVYVNFPAGFYVGGGGAHFEANGARPHVQATDGSVGTSVSGMWVHDVSMGGGTGTTLIDVQPDGGCSNLVVERVSCSNVTPGGRLLVMRNAIAPKIGPNSLGANIASEYVDVGNGSCTNLVVHGSTFLQVDTMGWLHVTTTGGNILLFVPDQAHRTIYITGVLTSDATIVMSTDQAGQEHNIINDTTGAHSVSLGGKAVTQGKSQLLVNDGTGTWYRIGSEGTF